MDALQTDIERRLAQTEPDIEVLLTEVVGGRCLRVFIDHPEGVTLDLCERVTHLLPEVREHYALEVSSPGRKRPLTKPDHFRRFLGRRARVRTRHPRAVGRALFHARHYARAAAEFHAVADRAPTNDYALFCLGRSMQLLGRHREACQPLALACSLRPEREDYRLYRDRARRDAHGA